MGLCGATSRCATIDRNTRTFYCTVKFTVLVAVAPPVALLAVTVTANVPAGVRALLLLPHPANASNATQAIAPANRQRSFLLRPKQRTAKERKANHTR